MNPDKSLPWVIGVIVVLTIGAGIWSVGGPATAKQEKRDKLRMSDLQDLNRHVICLAFASNKILPESLLAEDQGIEDCTPVPRLQDPFTDAPYEYEKRSDTGYRFCAGFEKPDLIAYPTSFDPETGCVSFQFNP